VELPIDALNGGFRVLDGAFRYGVELSSAITAYNRSIITLSSGWRDLATGKVLRVLSGVCQPLFRKPRLIADSPAMV